MMMAYHYCYVASAVALPPTRPVPNISVYSLFFQLVSGSRAAYMRPLSSAVVSNNSPLTQNNTQTSNALSLVSFP